MFTRIPLDIIVASESLWLARQSNQNALLVNPVIEEMCSAGYGSPNFYEFYQPAD